MAMERGVLYIATGAQRYVDFARVSARSLKSVSKLRSAIVTDIATDPGDDFDHVVPVVSCGDPYRDKVLGFAASPFERSLFLDSDTFVTRDPEPIFALLDRFDVAAAHAPNRLMVDVAVPDSHPEYNTGVVLWRGNAATEKMLRRWAERYDSLGCREPPYDQPSFREAIWTTPEIGVYVLPPEYNLRFTMAGFANLPITILHGYPSSPAEYPAIAATLGSKLTHKSGNLVFMNGRMIASDGTEAMLISDLRADDTEASALAHHGSIKLARGPVASRLWALLPQPARRLLRRAKASFKSR